MLSSSTLSAVLTGAKKTFASKKKNGVSVTGYYSPRSKRSTIVTTFKNGVKKVVSTDLVSANKNRKSKKKTTSKKRGS